MTLPKAEAFFVTDDGVHFTATQYSRGPWTEDACHGGPPTALMVRALELLDPREFSSFIRLIGVEQIPKPLEQFL